LSSRYGKAGWFGESHRHYLASKGIVTSRSVKQKHDYFSRDFLKGNRKDPNDPFAAIRKSLNAQGYNASEQERVFGIPLRPKKSKVLIDVPDRDAIAGARIEPTQTISPVAELSRPDIEVESFPEEQFAPPPHAGFPSEVSIEDKTVSDLTTGEKRGLMDHLQTKGVPSPPPSFATPGVAEMPPSSPFSQAPLVTTPAQQPFVDGSATTHTRPLIPKKPKKKEKVFDFVGINEGREALAAYSLKSVEDFRK